MTIGKVFVYGTLKLGGKFAKIYENTFDRHRVSCKDGRIKGTMFDLGPFPAIRLEGDGHVYGEVHTFKNFDEIIRIIDRIEGYSQEHDTNLYERKPVKVELQSGGEEEAYTYVSSLTLDEMAVRVIKCGVWKI